MIAGAGAQLNRWRAKPMLGGKQWQQLLGVTIDFWVAD
jgi:hypothetical protein